MTDPAFQKWVADLARRESERLAEQMRRDSGEEITARDGAVELSESAGTRELAMDGRSFVLQSLMDSGLSV